MLPPGHAAVAYLCYLPASAATTRRLPTGLSLWPLLVASQLPDLVDKPLVYYGLLPSGRALGHSAFTLVAVVALLLALQAAVPSSRTLRYRLLAVSPLPVAVGYGSHLLADSRRALLTGRYGAASYLLWPLLPAPRYPNDDVPPWVRLGRVLRDGGTDHWPVVALALVAFVVVQVSARVRDPAETG